MQVVGGNAATRALSIERALRDIRTSSLMPPNIDRMEQIVGSDYLDIGTELYK
jgi:alkylation response protein AidB-like acyl-CoA dehydrogenase